MPTPKTPPRRLVATLAVALVVALLAFAGPTGYAWAASLGRTSSVQETTPKPVAIVFGAGVWSNGKPMPFLAARLNLAKELYQSGKVRAILVSGDNRYANYNEPDAMRNYLIAAGIPAQKVVADYAGFDTYATCVRAKRIFGVSQALLATQSYHLPRALALCRAVGVDAWGVGDDTARSYGDAWSEGSMREWPANIKMVWDLVSGRQPVLGKKEDGIARALDS